MRELFNEPMKAVSDVLKEQVNAVEEQEDENGNKKQVRVVGVCGGFSDSPALRQEIKREVNRLSVIHKHHIRCDYAPQYVIVAPHISTFLLTLD
jgi:hypothetical protein